MSDLSYDLMDIQKQTKADSDRWFPDGQGTTVTLALGLVGETGEVVDWIKKWHRGSLSYDQMREGVRDEIADLFTYISALSEELGIDLAAEYYKKREFNETRFGK